MLAELYRTTFAQAGAYSVQGESLVSTPDTVMNPAGRNVPVPVPFTLDGSRLELVVGGRAWHLLRAE